MIPLKKSTVWFVFFIMLSFLYFGCGDSEYWHYFMQGSILTSIDNRQTEINTDSPPSSAYLFDMDMDGDHDLFVVSEEDVVLVYENLAAGRLSTPPLGYIVESVPQRMAVADFNNDNYLDMAITNQYSDDFAVLYNSSTGNFNNMTYISAGEEPLAILSEDFDKNGSNDLAISHLSNGTVTIFSGEKNATFSAKKDVSVGQMPLSIAASDIDKNGYPDILTANYESNDISVVKNAGDMYFHSEEVYPVKGSPSSIVTLDFNGDHFYDAAVTQYQSDSLIIFLNNGKGEFDQIVQFPTGKAPLSAITLDLDYNGWEDIVVANAEEDSLSFFMNSPTYLDQFKYALRPGFKTHFIAVGLLDDNQYYDLVLCDYEDYKILILFDVLAPQEL